MISIVHNGHTIQVSANLTGKETITYDGQPVSSFHSIGGGLHTFQKEENGEIAGYEVELGTQGFRTFVTIRRNGQIVFTDRSSGQTNTLIARSAVIIFPILAIAATVILLSFFGLIAPKGVIVSDQGDSSSSTLFEYSYQITATVRNEGKSGNITVKASLSQGGQSWERSLTKFVERGAVEGYQFVFEEPTVGGGQMMYSLTCPPWWLFP